ncbi:MAG TPA: hypothetical protein VGL56_02575 [Fimbriimonadaceae bacterium]
MFRAGHILWGPFPTGERKDRPCIVLIDEQPDGRVLFSYASTKLDFLADRTVILAPGCHPHITQDSCVVYEEAMLVNAAALKKAVGVLYTFNEMDILNQGAIDDLQAGIDKSDLTPEAVRNYARTLGVI